MDSTLHSPPRFFCLAHFALDSHFQSTIVQPKLMMQGLLKQPNQFSFHKQSIPARDSLTLQSARSQRMQTDSNDLFSTKTAQVHVKSVIQLCL